MFPLSRSVVIRVDNCSECHSEQLFRQRLPAGDDIDQTVQVSRLILPVLCLPGVMLLL